MNCNELKDSLNERFGDIVFTDSENEHLDICSDCRAYYNSMAKMDINLSQISIEPASPVEFAQMNVKLDRRIDSFVNRAFSFYRFGIRYGVALSAFILILFVSMIPQLNQLPNNYDSSTTTQYSYYDTQTSEENETLDDEYIDLVIDNYSSNNGYNNSSDMIIGDLEEDEFEYLIENLEVGDLL